MFTQEEFDSAYEIVSGFNNIRKQINDDPKLLSSFYDLYKSRGFKLESYDDVDKHFGAYVRYAVLECYFSLGFPHEYDKNVFEHFDMLTQVLMLNDNDLNYSKYVCIRTELSYARTRELYEKIFDINHDCPIKQPIGKFYRDFLGIDEYMAETFLILIKKLAFQLKKSPYTTAEGKKWLLELVRNELGLNPGDKPEYVIKRDEDYILTIKSDFFELIDKITSEFFYFVKNELLESERIHHFLMTKEPFCNLKTDTDSRIQTIKFLVEKDMFKIFFKLNHSINIDTFEGKILFLYLLKQADINPEFQRFDDYCYSLSLNPQIIKVRVIIGGMIRRANELTWGLNDTDSYDFYFKHILEQIDKELSKKYMILLYRFASIVAKCDGTITKEEEEWLSQMLAMTETENNSDKEQQDLRISQSSGNSTEELESLIGLTTVKKDVVSLANFIKMKQMRESKGLKAPSISYHCVFAGNSGTGKTTVARILANIFKELGILKSGHLVETDRSGLVAEYVGQTAVKTNKIIDSALDGVLFIDEAYTLVGGQNDYGKEAIATLLKRMEDDRDRLIVILAGYSKEMEDFINSNPGLRSRFNRYILFPDYTSSELYDIFQLNATKNEYVINEEANQYLKKKLDIVVQNKKKDFGNARYIRNYFELAIEHQANRLAADVDLTPEKLCELTLDDIDINT